VNPESITRICQADVFPQPSELDCTDAVAAALEALAGQSGDITRVEVRWQVLCQSGPCGSPTPNVAQAIIRYGDGRAVGVLIHLGEGNAISADDPTPINQAYLESPPPFSPRQACHPSPMLRRRYRIARQLRFAVVRTRG